MMLMLVQSNPSLLQQLGEGGVRQLKRELENLEKKKEIDGLTQEGKMEKDKQLWSLWIEKFRYFIDSEHGKYSLVFYVKVAR